MNELLTRYGVIYILLAVFLIARPWLSRKNVLFGVVFGGTDIWNQEPARKIVKRFIAACTAIALILAGIFLLMIDFISPSEIDLARLCTAAVFALLVLEMVPYTFANSGMKRLKAALPNENLVRNKITVEVGDAKPSKPMSVAWFLLLILPVAVTVILAALRYPGLPEKVVTHYGLNGIADAWETKSVSLIMGPIFNQVVIAAIMSVIGILSRIAPASVKGNPGAAPGYAAFRKFISFIIIAVALVVETRFLMTELIYLGIVRNMQTITDIITALIILLVVVLFAAFFLMVRGKKPSGAVLDDDDKWILGRIYFNPFDPSLFVEKRNGIGRTINFGRPMAWVILAALILFIIIRALWLK
ncbi:MAG: DUF5808 domain-containing protein [Bacillota bacterium]